MTIDHPTGWLTHDEGGDAVVAALQQLTTHTATQLACVPYMRLVSGSAVDLSTQHVGRDVVFADAKEAAAPHLTKWQALEGDIAQRCPKPPTGDPTAYAKHYLSTRSHVPVVNSANDYQRTMLEDVNERRADRARERFARMSPDQLVDTIKRLTADSAVVAVDPTTRHPRSVFNRAAADLSVLVDLVHGDKHGGALAHNTLDAALRQLEDQLPPAWQAAKAAAQRHAGRAAVVNRLVSQLVNKEVSPAQPPVDAMQRAQWTADMERRARKLLQRTTDMDPRPPVTKVAGLQIFAPH